MFAVFQFGMIQTVHASSSEVSIRKAPDIAEIAADAEALSQRGGGSEMVNARIAVSPYAQVVPDASYTFIGISHPSLATAHTSIGIVLEALNMTTVPNTAAGRAAVFTVDAGDTHRVFIVNAGHATINTSNDAFTDSKTHIIQTANTSQFGNIKVTGIHTNPINSTTSANRGNSDGDNGCTISSAGGCYAGETGATTTFLRRFDNVSQLAMWGVVYQSSNGAGFALEFIGDMHDSSASGTFGGGRGLGTVASKTLANQGLEGHGLILSNTTGVSGESSAGVGRGIN